MRKTIVITTIFSVKKMIIKMLLMFIYRNHFLDVTGNWCLGILSMLMLDRMEFMAAIRNRISTLGMETSMVSNSFTGYNI